MARKNKLVKVLKHNRVLNTNTNKTETIKKNKRIATSTFVAILLGSVFQQFLKKGKQTEPIDQENKCRSVSVVTAGIYLSR